MMNFVDNLARIKALTKTIVELLVKNEYVELDNMTRRRMRPASKFAEIVDKKGEILAMPPDSVFNDVCYFFIDDQQKPWIGLLNEQTDELEMHNLYIFERFDGTWSCDFRLWVEPTRESDFILRFTLAENSEHELVPCIDELVAPVEAE